MNILGLDVSTSITGASIIEDGKILKSYFWDTRNKKKFPTLYEKADFIKDRLTEIEDDFYIDKIFIEQSLQSFRSGFSSAKTLSTLSRFNGMVSLLCYSLFEKEPQMIAASSARKTAGVQIKRGDNAKEKVLQFVLDKYPTIKVEYTKHGNPKPGSYDLCDSIIIALAGETIAREERNIATSPGLLLG